MRSFQCSVGLETSALVEGNATRRPSNIAQPDEDICESGTWKLAGIPSEEVSPTKGWGRRHKPPNVLYISDPTPQEINCLLSDHPTKKNSQTSIRVRPLCISTKSDMRLLDLCLLLLEGFFLGANASPVELGLDLYERDLGERGMKFRCATCITQCVGWFGGCVAACGPFEIFTPIACAVCLLVWARKPA